MLMGDLLLSRKFNAINILMVLRIIVILLMCSNTVL